MQRASPGRARSSSATSAGALPIGGAYLQGDNNDDYVVSVLGNGVASYREASGSRRRSAAPGLRGRSAGALSGRGAAAAALRPAAATHTTRCPSCRLCTGALPAIGLPGSAALRPRWHGGTFRRALLLPPRRLRRRALRHAREHVLRGHGVALGSSGRRGARLPMGCRHRLAARPARALGRARRGGGARGSWPWGCAAGDARPRARRWRPTVAAARPAPCSPSPASQPGARPQFWNPARARPMFVHVLDMRIYQPFAKYFDEASCGYDDVYLASALAYAEDERGGSLDSLGAVEVRDLHDYHLRRVGELGTKFAGAGALLRRRAGQTSSAT